MNIDSKLLASYRNLLSDTKDNLAYQQFTDLITLMEINPTKRLEKSYKSLFKAIDKYSQGDMDKLLSHRFLFEVLGASPKKRERDLKRIANHFCDFVISAGSANTEGHRLTVRKYAQLVQDSVQSLHDLDIDRKNDDFHKIWIGELRERLDTRDNK
ncbi:hypothetical protein CMK18_21775 [Candidatus Poribacteria bacterium]|nr:hypothetical protein [Candidatus Poribacteria bacterium]|tara:strand:+ start:94 stop:561 length:468 start_codon:yes stop_codon:yes gene_type:complete